MNYEQLRSQWQPAPGSRLDVALGQAEEAAERVADVHRRRDTARAERALVQKRLDAVQLDSDVLAVADDITHAQALDLVIMRGQLELNPLKAARETAESEVAGIIGALQQCDKDILTAKERWGVGSSGYDYATSTRTRIHALYLATPESGE